jgi:WD40 repeat protein/Flp pilus assembly protein TadD
VNEEGSQTVEEQFASLVAACDEALAAGSALVELNSEVPAELRQRLERGVACMKLLRQALPPEHPTPTLAREPAARAALTHLGRFELRRELGHGAFGIVWLAHDPQLRRDVALKVPRAEALVSPEARQRLLREARAAAGLDHPNVVPVYEAGEVGSVCYIASAYCPGPTLAQWLKQRDEPVPAKEAAQLVATLAEAVEHAHRRGVVHRDLKPSNVLLELSWEGEAPAEPLRPGSAGASPSQGTPKITDFGLAKLLEGEPGASATGAQTESGAIVGTPCYMAPEQAGGHSREVGPAADIYALGAILYEVLTGRPPFQGETVLDILLQVRTQEPVPPGALRAKLPRDLETICLKCLEKAAARRYATAQALADDLRRFLADEPVQARPVGRGERVGRWCRRNPWIALPTAAAICLLLLAVAGTGVELKLENARALREIQHTEELLRTETEAKDKVTEALGKEKEALTKETAARAKEWQESYFHRIALARHEYQATSLDRANKYLDACVPGEAQADLRCWEWYYLKRLYQAPSLTVKGAHSEMGSHDIGVRVAFSRDGLRLAIAMYGFSLRDLSEYGDALLLLDARTGERLPDSPPFVIGSGPRLVPSWEPDPFSPDGQCVAMTGIEWNRPREIEKAIRVAKVWHTATHQEVLTLRGHRVAFNHCAFSPDGQRLATVDRGAGIVKIWDLATGREIHTLPASNLETRTPEGIKQVPRQVRCVVFSPDGKTLATGNGGQTSQPVPGEVKLWDVVKGQELLTLRGHRGGINSVAFSPDGRYLASGSGDNIVLIWDVKTGQPVRQMAGHTSYVLSVAFSPDGSRLASASTDKTVKIWGPRDQELRTLRGHTAAVAAVAWSPDGQRLASAGLDGDVRVWDVRINPEVRKPDLAYPPGRAAAVFSPDSQRLAVALGGGYPGGPGFYPPILVVFDPTTARELVRLPAPGGDSVAFSPDGRRLTAAGRTSVRCWDVESSKEVLATPAAAGGVTRLALSADGRRFAQSAGKEVKVCEVSTGNEILALQQHMSNVGSAVFSADGRRLASIDLQEVKVWDLASGQLLHTLPAPERHREPGLYADKSPPVAFSPDGRWLAAAGDYVRVWDALTGQEVQTLRGHLGWVGSLAFSPDSRRLASGGVDGSVKLWDVPTGYEPLGFAGFPGPVTSLAFSPNGRYLAAVSRNANERDLTGELRVWDTGEPWREEKAALLESPKVAGWLIDPKRPEQRKLMEQFTAQGGRALKLQTMLDQARSHAGQGQWGMAAGDYAEAVKADPDAAQAAYERVAVLLLLGVADGRQAGTQALERFAGTTNPWAASWVARLALLGPGAGADAARLVRLAEQAAAPHPRSGSRLQTLAAAHYRAGQYDQAFRRLQEAEAADWYGYPMIVNWLLLAQVHHRLGHAEEARRWLDKATAWLDQATQETPREQAEALHLDLHDLVACWLLRREAQLLLTGKVDDPPHIQNEAAWFLATGSEPQLRDPALAIALARKAVEAAPEKGAYWRTLGIAQYRAGDSKAALAALDRATPLGGADGAAEFFRAMAHWQLGERDQARRSYEAGVRLRVEATKSKQEDLKRFRDEAAALLGVARLLRSFSGHTHAASNCILSADGRAVSSGMDSTVRLWDTETGKQLRSIPFPRFTVSSLAFSPDGQRVLFGEYDAPHRLSLWDLETNKELRRLEGHTQSIDHVAFAPDGRRALSGSRDKTLRLWDLETGKELRRFEGHPDGVWRVVLVFSPDGKRALSAGSDKTLRLWDLETGKELRRFPGPAEMLRGVAFAPDGKRALSYSGNTVRMWDVETGKEIRRFEGHTGDIAAVAFSPDGQQILSGAGDSIARLWDVDTGRELHRFEYLKGYVMAVAFSPDGRRVLLGSADSSLQLWEVRRGQ